MAKGNKKGEKTCLEDSTASTVNELETSPTSLVRCKLGRNWL